MAKRLAGGRREEILDGVMDIIAARGFTDVGMAELARELKCSVSTLYKIAPNKDSLILLALGSWGEQGLMEMERRSSGCPRACDRARAYYTTAAEFIGTLSPQFREEVERFESTRLLWMAAIEEPFLTRFVELLNLAVEEGEVRPLNTTLIAEMVRRLSAVVRDERILRAAGVTAQQAALEIDAMIWTGIAERDSRGRSRC